MEKNKEGTQRKRTLSKKMTVFDPDKLPYQKQHLCIYLRELEEETEEGEKSDEGGPRNP